MKRKILCLAFVFILAFSVAALSACGNSTEIKIEYYQDGTVYHTQTVESASDIKLPEDPEKEGYTFDGWYIDNETWETAFNPTDVKESVKVYAKFVEAACEHTLTHHEAVAATCTNAGTVEYWSCSKCDGKYLNSEATVIAENLTIPASHNLTHHAAVASDCFNEGNVEYWSCSVCSETFSDANGTSVIESIKVAVTEHNYISGKCEICGDRLPSEGLAFNLINDGTAYEVSGIGTCTDSDIVIPETHEGLPVVKIGDAAFYQNSELKSVVIPKCVTDIASGAFYLCSELAVVTFKDESLLKSIGEMAFQNCSALKTIVLPEKLETIGPMSFCFSALESIVIPETVSTIGSGAFGMCTELTSIVIPNEIESIGLSAFVECKKLNCVEYENARYIGNSENPYLILISAKDKNIDFCNINERTKFIFDDAFNACINLNSLTIPQSVVSIGISAFYDCVNLESINIPDNIERIELTTFYNCTKLKSVIFGANSKLKFIDYHAFYNCEKLESITIPSSVIEIRCEAFGSCDSLANITFEDIEFWYVGGSDADSENNIAVNVSDSAQNATYFKTTYVIKQWYKK